MIINIFSSFDPVWFNLCYKNILTIILFPTLIIIIFWLNYNTIITFIILLFSFIMAQLTKTKLRHIKYLSLATTSLFSFIIYINLTGILPYLFRTTRQIIFTFTLGLPIWLMCIARRILYSIKSATAHLLPDSAPIWLNPFLVLIESIRIMVRPITLRFRLAANITAGHVVLTLISSFSVTTNLKLFSSCIILSRLYIVFELGICLIQAYIFCLLVSLYTNDHS